MSLLRDMPALGNLGDRLPLEIVRGLFWGPHPGTMKNPDNSLTNLTGCILKANIRAKIAGTILTSITFAITDAVNGAFTMEMDETKTALLIGGEEVDDWTQMFYWDWILIDSLSNPIPLAWGEALVRNPVTPPV